MLSSGLLRIVMFSAAILVSKAPASAMAPLLGIDPTAISSYHPQQFPPTIVFETELGRIVMELDLEHAPRTVSNFLAHVNGRFFDGLVFHRVISGFAISPVNGEVRQTDIADATACGQDW